MRKSDLILPNATLMPKDMGLGVSRLHACMDYIYKLKGKNKLESIEPGYYGINTLITIKRFQEDNNIHITGIYDKLTRQKLREVLSCR